MADFSLAIPCILKHEGGYVCNPKDPGGATNFGISLRFFEGMSDANEYDHDGDGRPSVEDIVNLTQEEACEIYKTHWWDKYGYGKIIDQRIAAKVFDLSVNMGGSRAHKLLQKTCNTFFGAKLTVDGNLGPASFAFINNITDEVESAFLKAYGDTTWQFYQDLITAKPSLSVFTNGWKKRAYSLC